MKLLITIAFVISLNLIGFGQDKKLKKNSVYTEVLGLGALYSINYDRNIHFNENLGITLGIGTNTLLFDYKYSPAPGIPVRICGFYQIKKHTIESGVGSTTFFISSGTHVAIFGQIGYKYSIIRDNFYIGIAFTPIFYDNGDFMFFPWAALKFGYKF